MDIYKYLGFHLIMSKKKTTEEFIKECKDKNIIYDSKNSKCRCKTFN